MKNEPLFRCKQQGFTLLELLIATVVFLVIAGAALSLFQTEQPLLNRQQNYSALNIAMRNSIAQMQLDVVNAGTGYYPGTDVSDWPVGVTITSQNPTSACNNTTTFTYSASCFDLLNIIATDPNTPATHPDNGTFNSSGDCIATNSSPIYLIPPTGITAATLAADYHNGDELILVNASNSQMTTILLNGAPTTVTSGTNTAVKLVFNTTTAAGLNSSGNDPLGISTSASNPKLSDAFCSTDWVMRLAPITYQVDTSTPSNPKLTRTPSGGTASVLAEQVVGFKVGAIAWNASDDNNTYSYCWNNATCTGNSTAWWYIRSVQVVLIGRTTPNPGSTFTYRNGFDGGPYQIESEIATINPRNMSMNND